MAEFIDVVLYHEPGEPADLWFLDDHGNLVKGIQIIDQTEATVTYRIQHDTVEKL